MLKEIEINTVIFFISDGIWLGSKSLILLSILYKISVAGFQIIELLLLTW